MEEKYFYVYKWYNTETNEVFYIGKGCRGRSNQISCRNQLFKEYYNSHSCAVTKIAYFDDEQEALNYEKELITYYRSQGQAYANVDAGGKGGLSFVWTKKMREYKSQFNPMKDKTQRKRMSENNPMKCPEIASKVAQSTRRPVIINNQQYPGVIVASEQLKVTPYTIITWCTRGYNTDGQPCRYADEPQKEYSDTIKQLGARAQSAKGVYIDNIYYPSVKEGAKSINTWPETLIRAMKANKTCKGHICQYANQQPS